MLTGLGALGNDRALCHALFVMWYDAFKAYDSINWGGLFAYLRYCGMDLLVTFYWAAFVQTSWAFLTGHGRTKEFTPHNRGHHALARRLVVH